MRDKIDSTQVLIEPRVSVILTTYNRSTFLKNAIKSVLNQTFKDFELIIVDDNSTDNTPDIIKCYDDKRIVYVRRGSNSGYQCVPKNDGIKISKGRYIAYLDDDNKYTEDHLEVLTNALDSNPDIDVVYGNRQHFSCQGFGETKLGDARRYDFDELCEGINYIDTSDIIHRKKAIYKIGGWDPQIKSMGDYDLILRLYKSGYRFQFIPKILTYYYHHKDSATSKRIFNIRPDECQFLWVRQSLFTRMKNFFKREIEYLLKDNVSLRKKFPKYGPTRVLKVNGLNDEIIYENRITNFIKRILRKFRTKSMRRLNDIKGKFSLSEARKLSNENLKRYARMINLKNKKILDVGIGGNPSKGGYRKFFEVGNDYKTLDIAARWNPDYCMDIHKTTFSDELWDLIILTNVLEHTEDYASVIKEVYRILKPNGYLILETPYNYPFHPENDFKDFWRFTADAHRLLLNNFEIVDIGQYGGSPNLPSFISTLARKTSYDLYKKLQLEESAWTVQHEQYQKLLIDSINYLTCKLSNNPNLKILDLGCGDGFSISVFKSNGFNNIIGIDLHAEKVKLAKKLGHDVLEGDVHNLPFGKEEFDVVFASHILEHSYDIKKVIAELKRVTKKNGCVFVIIPIEKNTKNPAHKQPIANAEILTSAIEEYKFDIIQKIRIKRMEEELWLLCINRCLGNENLPVVILDLDDFSPLYSSIDLLLKFKDYYPHFRVSLFTVSNFNKKYPISKFKPWCDKIRKLDFVELLIHGYDHTPGEFKRISKRKAVEKIISAEREFMKSGLKYKKIFRAPHWQLNNETYSALSELGYAVADHEDNAAPRELTCYQYNWSINAPIPNLQVIKGHGHMQNVCGNGLKECFENLFQFPNNTKFITISEYIRMDSSIFIHPLNI